MQMEDNNLESSVLDNDIDVVSDEYGFNVESWDDDVEDMPQFEQSPAGQIVEKMMSLPQVDIPMSIMAGIAENGVKPILDSVMATSYGLTNLAKTGEFETPTAKEMEEDITLIPKSSIHYEPKTNIGNIIKPIAGGVYGASVAATGLRGAGVTGKAGIITNATLKGISKSKDGIAVGKVLSPLIEGIIGNNISFWEDEGNLSNMLQPHISNPTIKSIVDYMSLKEDDTFAERMMKQGFEAMFTAGVAGGLTNVFKGLKKGYKYLKGKKEIMSVSSQELAEKVSAPIIEKAETAEEIAKSVADGKRIEPATKDIKVSPAETIQPKESTIVEQTVEQIQQTAKELGPSSDGIVIPRNPQLIDKQAAKNRVAAELSDYIDIENPESIKKLDDFLKTSDNAVEKTMGTLKAQQDTFIGGWTKLKAAKNNALANGVSLSNADKTAAFKDFMESCAIARGKVDDVLYEGASAMNVASKDAVHKTNKKMLEQLKNNLDEISTPELFDIFESAQTEDELISKINAFFANASDAVSKKGFDVKKLVALEQAGLMSSTDTLVRNAFTSVENLTLGVIDDVAESMLNSVSTQAVKMGGNARNLVDIVSKGAAYYNFVKEQFLWGLQKVRNNRLWGNPNAVGISPVAAYRKTLSRRLNTNLPTELGHTFSNESTLGKIGNAWIRVSGVGLSETTDSFFDAAFFRGSAAQRVNAQARRLKKMYNLSDEQAQKIGKTMLDNITNTDNTRRAYEIAEINEAIFANIETSISKKASKDAAEMTFRSGQGFVTKGLTKFFNSIPVLKLGVPFVKTSSTIVFDRFVYDRTPFGLAYEGGKTLLGLISPNIKSQLTNPTLRNKFLSKQVVGAGLLYMGYNMYANGQITGDYPEDPGQRKVWQAAGIQPNSLVLTAKDGSKKYVSLNNLGVMSMLLKYPAKFAQYYNDFSTRISKKEKINETEIGFLSNLFGASIPFSKAVAEETVLRNVADFFDRLNRGFNNLKEMEDFAINIATNPVKNMVPRLLRQALSDHDFEEISQNNLEALKNTFSGMPIKHDVFGDEVERADFGIGMAGFQVKNIPEEDRFKAIMAKYELSVPTVESLEFPTKGRSVRLDDDLDKDKLYVKMKELGLKDAIKAVVLSIPEHPQKVVLDRYQEKINAIYNKYKKNALRLLTIDDEHIKENYNRRIDFDVEQKYNNSEIAEPIPSLADF